MLVMFVTTKLERYVAYGEGYPRKVDQNPCVAWNGDFGLNGLALIGVEVVMYPPLPRVVFKDATVLVGVQAEQEQTTHELRVQSKQFVPVGPVRMQHNSRKLREYARGCGGRSDGPQRVFKPRVLTQLRSPFGELIGSPLKDFSLTLNPYDKRFRKSVRGQLNGAFHRAVSIWVMNSGHS